MVTSLLNGATEINDHRSVITPPLRIGICSANHHLLGTIG
jgi:hypothetical protein